MLVNLVLLKGHYKEFKGVFGWFTLFSSTAHDTDIEFVTVFERREIFVISTGRLGRFGSAPGLLVGMGF